MRNSICGVTDSYDQADFTESSYEQVLAAALRTWKFECYGTEAAEPHVLWRHDVDVSVHRAARLAEVEEKAGARATYCFTLHSPYYNLLERGVLDLARAIASRGHWVGLHFETGFYDWKSVEAELPERLAAERRLIEQALEVPVSVFSFHNPDLEGILGFDMDTVGGMWNTYARTLRERYEYVSDSNGYWRHRRLLDVVEEGVAERLHVLTHPEWWQSEPMLPRDRIRRSIEGRARRTLEAYDDVLEASGRENVGR
jgi:hypothetical protein